MPGKEKLGEESPKPREEVLLNDRHKRQYLIAPRPSHAARSAGMQPMAAGALDAAVDQMGLDVVRRVKRPRRTLATFGAGPGEATDLLVAHMDPDRAQLIAATAPHLSIGENMALRYGGPAPIIHQMPAAAGLLPVTPKKIAFRVLGSNDQPLSGVSVTLSGDTVPAQGQTDANGEITLDLYTLHDQPARTLFVTSPSGYWDKYLTGPHVSDSAVNIVRLRAYGETIEGFPEGFRHGWGQRLMGLDRLPANLAGQGVKIAIIDSGADNSHPLLSHIQIGRDFSDGGDPTTWNKDVVGHGSHCAGVITARSDHQLTGFAPEAEIHILKVFPGGKYDSLIDALDYCIDNQIDVVNMSLGGGAELNQAVEDTLTAAALSGVACIVAAGNSGDAVQYPARSRNVLAVAAIGDVQEIQASTWDHSTFQRQFASADGVFSPTFTCHGPEIAVCAPGVAIISTVPGGKFEAESGTSMAAPHITGLSALLLAHHPIFRAELRERNQARVAGLFGLLRSLGSAYPFGADRTGAGLPKLDSIAGLLRPAGEPAHGTATPASMLVPVQAPPVFASFPGAQAGWSGGAPQLMATAPDPRLLALLQLAAWGS